MGTEDMVSTKPQNTVSYPKPIMIHMQKTNAKEANNIAPLNNALEGNEPLSLNNK